MRERMTPSEYSELTDAFNGLFSGNPIETPKLVNNRGIIASKIIGKEYKSNRGTSVVWTENNPPGTVPPEFVAYERSQSVYEARYRILNPFGKTDLDDHRFTIRSSAEMGADYQLAPDFSQTLAVDLETFRASQLDIIYSRESDPIAAFCKLALSQIDSMKTHT